MYKLELFEELTRRLSGHLALHFVTPSPEFLAQYVSDVFHAWNALGRTMHVQLRGSALMFLESTIAREAAG